jgi:hypothetical protein
MHNGYQNLHFFIPLECFDIRQAERKKRRPDWPRRPAPR